MIARSLAAFLALGPAALAPASAAAFDFAPNDRVTASIEGGRFTPKRPPVTTFGPGVGSCPRQAVQLALADELDIVALTSKMAPAQPDVRLCAAAEAFLAWDAKDPVPTQLAAAVGGHFGLLANFPRVAVVNVPEDDPKAVAQAVLDVVGSYSLNAKRPRYGLMYQRMRKKLTRVAIALADLPPLALEAPRALAAGQSARLTGSVTDDLDRPRVLVSDAAGKLTSHDTPQGSKFDAEVRCGDRPGTIRIEIRAELGGSPALVTRFPITCGKPLESSFPVAPPEPWTGDLAAQARRAVEVINTERAASGLAALAWDEALAGVATGVAEAIKQEVARGAFDVPRDLVERLKKVGIASPVVLQNPAQGRSVQEVMDQMSASPAHRSSYMDPSVTNVGVGVASTTDADGRTQVFMDQLFVKELPALEPVATAEKLRAAVIQKRKDGRFPAAAADPDLDAFAQAYAKELAGASGVLPKARHAELTRTLDKRFRTVNMTSGARQDPLDFAEEPEVTSPGKLFGVGVALGMNEKLGRNAVYAVIVVGQERGGKDAEPAAGKKGKKKK